MIVKSLTKKASEAIRYGDYKLINGCPGLLPSIYQQTNTTANPKTTLDYTYCNDQANSSSSRNGTVLLFNIASMLRLKKNG